MESVIQIYIDRLAQANHNCILLEARVKELEGEVERLKKYEPKEEKEDVGEDPLEKEEVVDVQDK